MKQEMTISERMLIELYRKGYSRKKIKEFEKALDCELLENK